MTQNKMLDVIYAIERADYDSFYTDSYGQVWFASVNEADEEAEKVVKYIRADIVDKLADALKWYAEKSKLMQGSQEPADVFMNHGNGIEHEPALKALTEYEASK
ncbi:hypothetical protein [Dyadobacter psychrotolerans]|uniref:Uncharacterized protein n=1 Tax=Dyadobacter psychrotolerans TaxID=2541721 RepID=A0A4V2Z4R6_9BACT|nr:hypothetical protein [Dyadobacter psychrotolerans]TDE17738.1 hypothetical protein E0F88_07555 [Dyadobacter psychrotolerans]